MRVCKCGCGKVCTKNFKRGHGSKGRVLSEKHRKNIGLACKGKIPWNKDLTKVQNPELNFGGHLKGYRPSNETIAKLSDSHKGQISWNNGLTKETNSSVARTAEKRRGRIVSEATREKQRIAATGKKNSAETIAKRMQSSGKHKFPYVYLDGTIRKMRSNWEVLYAQYLDSIGTEWLYEPKMFKLSTGKYYWPDFYLPELNEYHEIKGYMRYCDKEKVNLFIQEYSYINFKLLVELDLKNLGVL